MGRRSGVVPLAGWRACGLVHLARRYARREHRRMPRRIRSRNKGGHLFNPGLRLAKAAGVGLIAGTLALSAASAARAAGAVSEEEALSVGVAA
jgi:hypothetical protein